MAHPLSVKVRIARRTKPCRLRVAFWWRRLTTGKVRRIQIVPEIEAHRADRSPITHSDADRVRDVVVVALKPRAGLTAELRIGLRPLGQAVEHVVARGKHVAGILKDGEAQGVLKVWQRRWR